MELKVLLSIDLQNTNNNNNNILYDIPQKYSQTFSFQIPPSNEKQTHLFVVSYTKQIIFCPLPQSSLIETNELREPRKRNKVGYCIRTAKSSQIKQIIPIQ